MVSVTFTVVHNIFYFCPPYPTGTPPTHHPWGSRPALWQPLIPWINDLSTFKGIRNATFAKAHQCMHF